MRRASKEWRDGQVDPTTRARLEDQRKALDEKYKQELKHYKSELKKPVKLEDVMRLLPKSVGGIGRQPKRLSGYNVFVIEKTTGVKGTPDWKAISNQWASMSDYERNQYNEKAVRQSAAASSGKRTSPAKSSQ